jgi:glycosyltransferase involved in cell wall biosynthesis
MHVILPMTYGAEPGYLDAVEEACRLGNLRYTILRNFLSQEEMVGLRYATDILVRLSRFDAFSLSLCESLCAGTVVISATWLPYGYLRAAGIHFRELSAITDLTHVLPRVLDNLPEERDRCRDNPAKIMHLFEGMHPARSLAELLTV